MIPFIVAATSLPPRTRGGKPSPASSAAARREDGVEHRARQPSGERVLLARVIRASEHQSRSAGGARAPCAKRGPRPRDRVAAGACRGQERRRARSGRARRRPGARRAAPARRGASAGTRPAPPASACSPGGAQRAGGGHVRVAQPQPVVARDRRRLVREAGAMERAIEPVAALVAGEDAARCDCRRAPPAPGRRPGARAAGSPKPGNRPAPVRPVAKARDLLARDALAMRDQPRTAPAADDRAARGARARSLAAEDAGGEEERVRVTHRPGHDARPRPPARRARPRSAGAAASLGDVGRRVAVGIAGRRSRAGRRPPAPPPPPPPCPSGRTDDRAPRPPRARSRARRARAAPVRAIDQLDELAEPELARRQAASARRSPCSASRPSRPAPRPSRRRHVGDEAARRSSSASTSSVAVSLGDGQRELPAVARGARRAARPGRCAARCAPCGPPRRATSRWRAQ